MNELRASDRPRTAVTLACTAFAMVAFAANSLLCRLALRTSAIDPGTFTTLRLVSGAVLLAVWVLVARGRFRLGGDWAGAALLALYAIAFSFAYVELSVGTAALILFGTVQVTMLVAALLGGERPPALEWAGLLCALAGLVVLVAPGLTAPPLGASALMAVAGIGWGGYSLRGRGAVDPLRDTAGNFARSVPMGLAINLLTPRAALHLQPAGALYAAASGALASGVGYAVWYVALRGLTATRAAVVQLSVPVLAAAAGRIVLGERVSMRLLVAGAMILGGIGAALAARGRRPAAAAVSRRPLLAYFWASPATLLALVLFFPLARLGGGRARWVAGVLELDGGGLPFFLSRLVPIRGGATALTLGHVVVARSAEGHARTRSHERVHVLQYERFGPFMLPAYVLLSLVMLLRGRHYYFDHPFETEARREAALVDGGEGPGGAG
jgi:drug/metabolite transporter (DMT)-like permease